MKIVRARHENGALTLEEALPLRPGEWVRVIVLRKADPERWNLGRLAAGAAEDEEMARAGLAEWADGPDAEDGR